MDKAPSLTELCDLVEAYCDMRPTPDPQSDFLTQLGLCGDDVDELLSVFASHYGVAMRAYLWYFHTREEGANPGALFFKPPNARVPYIPLTLATDPDRASGGGAPRALADRLSAAHLAAASLGYNDFQSHIRCAVASSVGAYDPRPFSPHTGPTYG